MLGSAFAARCKVTTATARPSVVNRARPSSSTSRGRGAPLGAGSAWTARQSSSIPPKITFCRAKGFTLWLTRSVLSGLGDEVLDVAKTNLRELALT